MFRSLILLLVLGLPFVATAQSDWLDRKKAEMDSLGIVNTFEHPYSTVFKSNPFAVIWGPIPFVSEYRVVAEVAIGKRASIVLGASYLGKSPILTILEDTASSNNAELPLLVTGYRVQGGYRIYLNGFLSEIGIGDDKPTPKGVYLSPHFSYSSARFTNRHANQFDQSVRSTHLNFNLLLGYQFFLSDRFVLDVFSGMGVKKNKWVEKTTPNQVTVIDTEELGRHYNSNLKLNLGFNMGYAF